MNILRIIFAAVAVIVFSFFALIFGAVFAWCLSRLEADTKTAIARIVARLADTKL